MNWNPERLKGLIEASHLSRKQVAEATGVGESTINTYCAGTGSPQLDNLIKLADFFAVPIDYLIGRCTEEQAKAIADDYGHSFMELRREPYERYLVGRMQNNYFKQGTTEAPYPYNLVDDICGEPIDWIIREKNEKGIEYALSTLTEREQRLIEEYYKKGKTLHEIGESYGVTQERVRQIIRKGIRKMAHPSRYKYISEGLHTLEGMTFDETIEFYENNFKERNEALTEREKKLDAAIAEFNKNVDRFNKLKEGNIDSIDIETKKFEGYYDAPIEELDLSVRSYNALHRAGLYNVSDVIDAIDNNKIHELRNLGKKSEDEVREKIKLFIEHGQQAAS